MRLHEWCQAGQDDQNTQRLSHLHSNYRSSRAHKLISWEGLDAFVKSINKINPGAIRKRANNLGLANAIILEAQHQFYRSSKVRRAGRSGPTIDFRMAGKEIDNEDEVFANVYVIPVSNKITSTGPSKARIVAPQVSYRIRWLTRPSTIYSQLERAVRSKRSTLNDIELFRELVSLLGLKPLRGPEAIFGLRLYRISAKGILRRPHVFSTGYPDRFCGVSRFRPYGATADNRSGECGLPEAIGFETDLNALAPSEKTYADFRAAIARYAPVIGGIMPGQLIEFRLDTNRIHQHDLEYEHIQRRILRRLRGNRRMCVRFSGTNRCLCTPAGHLA